MIICQCKGTTDREVHEARTCGARNPGEVGRHCDAGTVCGGCIPTIKALLRPAGARATARSTPRSAA
ncbi:MAG: (2Fe-2S)-binding protein [Planctomycetota bacterium]|jgi:bacterioferritin-associated ferredoxin